MSLIKFNKTRFPWINEGVSDLLGTDNFFSDDFFVKDRHLPAMNIKENKNNYEIELAVPGFSKKDIHVTIEDDILNIAAQNSQEQKDEKEGYTRQEFSYNQFERQLQLPTNVDKKKEIKATYENGILKLNLIKDSKTLDTPKKNIKIT